MSSTEAGERIPPIIAVVGASKTGKTTLIEGLTAKLKSRGYRVATIKHAAAKLSFDKPFKDSWRHIKAGSVVTLVVSSVQLVLIKPLFHELSLDEAVQILGVDYDIVLVEGFKQSDVPKIKLCGKSETVEEISLRNLVAIVTERPLEAGVRCFSPKEVDRLVDFLEESFLSKSPRKGTV